MNIVYIGSSGPFSYLPLESLIYSQYNIAAIAIDSLKEELIPCVERNAETLSALAFNNNIPLIKLTKNEISNVAAIAKIDADIIFVSCYARKIPCSIFNLAKIGCFNIHPSLLPKYRGPTPLFWQFKKGEENFGVTLHRLTENFDDGDIISQETIKMPEGISKTEASMLLAKLASEEVLKILPLLQNRKIKEIKQDEAKASYQSYVKKEDYEVSTSWTAKHLYNFIAANKRTMLTFPCEIEGKVYKLLDATSYQVKPYAELKNALYFIDGDQILFKCYQGYIRCVLNEN